MGLLLKNASSGADGKGVVCCAMRILEIRGNCQS